MKSLICFLPFVILFGLCALLPAQPPLPPPIPPGMVAIQPATNTTVKAAIAKPARTPAFTSTCPHCNVKQAHVRALAVQTNGSRSIAGGFMVERTIHMVCHNPDCGQQYSARNEKFVPEVIAVEESD